MNLEIKNRLAQIRAGKIPEGYKNTPIGILKSDWSYAKLNEIVDILTETNINDFKKAKEFLWSISLRPMLEAYCGTMDDRKQKEFIDNCRNAFMSQDAIEQNNNNKNNL